MASFSELVRDFLMGDLTKEVRNMSQALNDRLDQLNAALEAEKEEIAASLQVLRDAIAQGQLANDEIVRRMDDSIQRVRDLHTPDAVPTPTDPDAPTPTPI
jgi:phage host-nuclease inhibitor protein Gam